MFFPKTFMALAILFAGISARYVNREDYLQPRYIFEESNVGNNNYEDAMSEQYSESVQPNDLRLARSAEDTYVNPPAYVYLEDVGEPSNEAQESHRRFARQVHGQITANLPDGTVDISGGVPLTNDGKNALTAIGSVQGIKTGGFDSAGAGLQLENVHGYSLTGLATHIPNVGNQLSAAGTLNLIKSKDHNLDATAFAARTFSNTPSLPSFNTYGGNLDYMYKGKIGASVGATHFPSFDRTDYSAMGKLNLMKTRSSSLDFNAGVTRMTTPFFSHTEPRISLGFTRRF